MKAIRVVQGRVVVDHDVPVPRPDAGQALIRTTRVGLCHASARALLDPRGPDRILGREYVGVVERVGTASGRTGGGNLVGKRVVGSASTSCGLCDRCRSGMPAHCRERRVLGEPGVDGCFAEFFTVPLAALVEVPGGIGDDDAALAATFAAASHLARAVPVSPRIMTTVIGDSAVGLVTAAILAKRSATVRILTHREASAIVCEKWGLRHRPASEAGLRHDQDIVIDAGASASSLSLAVGMARPRGTIFVARTDTRAHGEAVPEAMLDSIASHELTLKGVCGEDFPGGVAILSEGMIPAAPLITGRGVLDQVPGLVCDPAFVSMVKVVGSVQ